MNAQLRQPTAIGPQADLDPQRNALLRALSDAELLDLTKSPAYIGTFNEHTRVEFIEDDLLHWMRHTN